MHAYPHLASLTTGAGRRQTPVTRSKLLTWSYEEIQDVLRRRYLLQGELTGELIRMFLWQRSHFEVVCVTLSIIIVRAVVVRLFSRHTTVSVTVLAPTSSSPKSIRYISALSR